jgi:hypothetical protein
MNANHPGKYVLCCILEAVFAVPATSLRRLTCGVVMALMLAAGGPTWGQDFEDDFDDGTDDGWSKLDLTPIGSPATFSFPDDGAGGQAYRIFAPPPALAGFGPARAFSYRSESYGRMVASVDVLDWATGIDQAFGLLVRATGIGLGQTDGYVMNYNSLDGNLQINEINNESPTTIAVVPVPMDPETGPYRWIFSAYDGDLMGQVFSHQDLTNPLATVAASNANQPNGQAGVFVFDRNDPDEYTHADATFDNYSVTVPAAGTLRTTVVGLEPRPFETLRQSRPQIRVQILDRETFIELDSIRFWFDGVEIPSTNFEVDGFVELPENPVARAGATVMYQVPEALEAGGTYTSRVVFEDHLGFVSTNEWSFSAVPLLAASNAMPPGSGEEGGFAVRVVQTLGEGSLANSLVRAEQQLATPPELTVDISTNTVAEVINFTQNAVPGSADGYFVDAATFPGIDPAGDTDDFAMEALFYLELEQGFYRLGVRSDDGFQLSTGSSLASAREIILGEKKTGTFDGTFEFGVEAGGLYPFRLVYFERGGGAHIELFSVDLEDPESRTLINDPESAGAIKAWRTVEAVGPAIAVESTASLSPPAFAVESAAIIDEGARTITIPQSGATRFYRLGSATALTITGIVIDEGNIILSY